MNPYIVDVPTRAFGWLKKPKEDKNELDKTQVEVEGAVRKAMTTVAGRMPKANKNREDDAKELEKWTKKAAASQKIHDDLVAKTEKYSSLLSHAETVKEQREEDGN